MKRHIKISFFLLVFLIRVQGAPAYALSISILAPSADELAVESGRDIYVIGKIDRGGKSPAEMPFDIRVDVVETALARDEIFAPVRTVRSCVDPVSGVTPQRDVYFRYEGKAPWVDISREELLKFPPPDLIYRHGEPESFTDPSLKAVVTEDRFAVLIQGGATKDFDTDYVNVYDKDLEWKLYRVIVTAFSGEDVLAAAEADIMYGTVQQKVLARFSPEDHMKKVLEFANKNGFRLYRDPFPGYWVCSDSVYEVPLRWRANDSLEYVAGRVHAVIYNIREKMCAAQEVEIGRMAFEGWLDSDDVTYYHYDIGEPSLKYRTWCGVKEKHGTLTAFEAKGKLVFTRAESGHTVGPCYPDNVIDNVDWNVYDSVAINRGEPLVLCGVVTPIQPRLSEVIPNDDGTFCVGDRITSIRYRFTDMTDGLLFEDTREVMLERRYRTSSEDHVLGSIYEFRHLFNLPEELCGRVVTVFADALDKKGEHVDGSAQSFYFWVRESQR